VVEKLPLHFEIKPLKQFLILMERSPQLLLKISLKDLPAPTQMAGMNYRVFAGDGVEIATAKVNSPYGAKAEKFPEATIDIVEIKPERQEAHKGKGYGRAIYVEILKRLPAGVELTCDGRGVKPDALKVWQWLELNGLAARPEGAAEPVLDERGSYPNLGYRTRLAELADFAASH
jgi:hypothetical protein